MIKSFQELSDSILNKKRTKLVAANATDSHTLSAITRAVEMGFIEAFLVGNAQKIESPETLQSEYIHIIDIEDKVQATETAVQMVRESENGILMKGLVNTDVLLRAILNKEKGILPPGSVLSHVGVLEIPRYHKMLFFTDAAVIPNPTLEQRMAQINYSIDIARKFGIERPKIAMLHASEKPSPKIQYTQDYLAIMEMHRAGKFGDVIIDGPLDLSLSIDKESCLIKKVNTLVDGDADVLVFPNIESANCYYKAMTYFADAKMAGLLQGTDKPAILMSRSESPESKFFSILMACL